MANLTSIAQDITTTELTEDEINRLWDLLREKSKGLRAKATAMARFSLSVGAEVFTIDLRPKALNGLTGKVTKIGKTRADVELDKELDSWHPARKYTKGRMLTGVPLNCLKENKLRVGK